MNEIVNDAELKRLIRLFGERGPLIKVGILSGKDSRKDGSSNAFIGTIHEFGSKIHPQRSFLRVPIADYMQKYIDKFVKQKKLSLIELMNKVGLAAKKIVQEGFTNEGYGKWIRTKTIGNTLVDTQQLRDSIDYEAV